jgi:hypothetical protein
MAKLNLKITAKEKALLEHYAYGIVAAGYGSYQINHNASVSKIVTEALVGGLLAPLLARVNPKSLVNTIVADSGAPAPLVTQAVTTVLADANKVVEANAAK